MSVFYGELASWWPILSPLEEYEEEATTFAAALGARRPAARDLLELGCGGGHVAWYLRRAFDVTLTDLSPEMLRVAAALNAGCDVAVGDMRTLDLGRTFDLVFVHDAVDYLRTEADLAATARTARRHLRPGGLALFVPDHVAERYAPDTGTGGSDGTDGRAARFLEWSERGADGNSCVTHYSFVLREPSGEVTTRYERHELGLFPTATWVRALEQAGLRVEVVEETTTEDHAPRLLFFGHA
ncbi:MAG: class I SAM-dependent methyltransferase, partial [Myxococcota bacterium]